MATTILPELEPDADHSRHMGAARHRRSAGARSRSHAGRRLRPTVFINYRVQEQPGYATLLHHELSHRFGPDFAFLAPNSIQAGDDFIHAILDNLRRCTILLAVIGSHWLDHHEASSWPGRTIGVGDWAHNEIAEAFALGIRVIPVLIDEAQLPSQAALPAVIAPLARCQYLRLRHYSIASDLGALVRELRQYRGCHHTP